MTLIASDTYQFNHVFTCTNSTRTYYSPHGNNVYDLVILELACPSQMYQVSLRAPGYASSDCITTQVHCIGQQHHDKWWAIMSALRSSCLVNIFMIRISVTGWVKVHCLYVWVCVFFC